MIGVMSVFAVVFTRSHTEITDSVKEHFPGAYQLTDSTFLVRSEGLSSQIAELVGIKGENRRFAGAVFKINHSYSGFTSRDLWEWLDEADAS